MEDAGQLEGEEGVPTRALVDAEERLACEGPIETIEEQAVNGSDAQRSDGDPPNILAAQPQHRGRAC